jgi:uncharacterized protein YkwD
MARNKQALLLLAWVLVLGPAFGQSVREHNADRVESPGEKHHARGPDLERVARRIVELTNAFRREHGRGELKENARLTKAAAYDASYLARTDKFSHTADGSQPWERAAKFGYDYCIELENIAWRYEPTTPEAEELAVGFVEGWKKSPGHRRNMLDRDVTEIGVAVARSSLTGRYYAVQEFGRPKSEAISFQITSSTEKDVEYTLDGKSFTVRPGYTVTHQRCRPPRLSFKGARGQSAFRPRNGDHYVLREAEGGGLRVTKE